MISRSDTIKQSPHAFGFTLWGDGRREGAAVARRGGGARADVWARPGMSVVFRAELMPGRSASERTFRVASVLSSRRVIIEGIAGEHTPSEFEPHR